MNPDLREHLASGGFSEFLVNPTAKRDQSSAAAREDFLNLTIEDLHTFIYKSASLAECDLLHLRVIGAMAYHRAIEILEEEAIDARNNKNP